MAGKDFCSVNMSALRRLLKATLADPSILISNLSLRRRPSRFAWALP